MSPRTKVYRLLGLARRAGVLAPGIDAVRRAIRMGEACVVVMARDASHTQLAKIRGTLKRREIPQVRLGDRIGLGAAVGLSPLSAVAVTDAPLAEQVLAELGASVAAGE